jgi:hypothetical protein
MARAGQRPGGRSCTGGRAGSSRAKGAKVEEGGKSPRADLENLESSRVF